MKIHLTVMMLVVSVFWGTSALGSQGWLGRGMELFRDQPAATDKQGLSEADIAQGLREALRVGSENVVASLGRENGYYLDPRAHIPLPDGLQQVQHIMNRAGMGRMLDDLELRMNRAAEEATPKAREMFADAVSRMTLEDALAIYNGPDDSATRFFQEQMSAPLSDEFTPVVRQSLADAGAVRVFESLMEEYRQLPFVPDIKEDLSSHVVEHSIAAIFEYLALEERAIRNNPVKQTTDILRKVFGR